MECFIWPKTLWILVVPFFSPFKLEFQPHSFLFSVMTHTLYLRELSLSGRPHPSGFSFSSKCICYLHFVHPLKLSPDLSMSLLTPYLTKRVTSIVSHWLSSQVQMWWDSSQVYENKLREGPWLGPAVVSGRPLSSFLALSDQWSPEVLHSRVACYMVLLPACPHAGGCGAHPSLLGLPLFPFVLYATIHVPPPPW